MKILHVDDHILIIDKPAGLSVLPDGWDARGRDAPYLVKLLKKEFGKIFIVHRLDKTTSGVMVFARTAEAHRALNIQFERHEVKKIYHALAEGNPKWDEHTARHPLRANVGHKHRTVVDNRDGKPSVTNFRVLERFGSRYDASRVYSTSTCLLEAIPETGRTHQVRVHASELGHPLLADSVYGSRVDPSTLRHSLRSQGSAAVGLDTSGTNTRSILRQAQDGTRPTGLTRPALHALSLTLLHPASGESVTFTAPYPEDFASMLSRLRAVKP